MCYIYSQGLEPADPPEGRAEGALETLAAGAKEGKDFAALSVSAGWVGMSASAVMAGLDPAIHENTAASS